MSQREFVAEEILKFDEEGKDRVLVRGLKRSERHYLMSLVPNNALVEQFVGELKQVIDKQKADISLERFLEAAKEIKTTEEDRAKLSCLRNDYVMKHGILEAYDEGKKVERDEYIATLSDAAFMKILDKIISMTYVKKADADFLAKRPESSLEV